MELVRKIYCLSHRLVHRISGLSINVQKIQICLRNCATQKKDIVAQYQDFQLISIEAESAGMNRSTMYRMRRPHNPVTHLKILPQCKI